MSLYIFSLDLVSRTYPIITRVDGLPYDSLSLIPCSSALGGVVILASNAVIHVDQATRRVALPVNGWLPRVSDMPSLPTPVGMRELRLEGARMAFVQERTLFVLLVDGTIIPFEFVVDGKMVSRLVMGAALAQTASPAIVQKAHGEHLFVGSMVGPSVLLRTASVEEPVTEVDDPSASGPAAVVDAGNAMDLDDDDGVHDTPRSWLQRSLMNSPSQTYTERQAPIRYPLPQLCHRRKRGPSSISHYATRFLPMGPFPT
jgi:cleavage and polyadenylation specificity factor subunit 1